MSDSIASRLRLLRALAGNPTQQRAARAARLRTLTYLSQLEHGHRPDPHVSTVVALARAYGVTVDWLATGTGTAVAGRPRLVLDAESRAAQRAIRAAFERANDNAAAQEAA